MEVSHAMEVTRRWRHSTWFQPEDSEVRLASRCWRMWEFALFDLYAEESIACYIVLIATSETVDPLVFDETQSNWPVDVLADSVKVKCVSLAISWLLICYEAWRVECCHTLHGAERLQSLDWLIVVFVVDSTFFLVDVHHDYLLETLTLHRKSTNCKEVLADNESCCVYSSRYAARSWEFNALTLSRRQANLPKIVL